MGVVRPMRGSVAWQVQTLFKDSGISRLGQSKHEAKARAREELLAAGQKTPLSAVAKRLGIHSRSTAESYQDVWKACLSHAKREFGVKDIEKLTGQIVQSFLEEKISQGVARLTFNQYASACEKLGCALTAYAASHDKDVAYDFSERILFARQTATELAGPRGDRAYLEPEALLEEIGNDGHKLAAALQYEGGGRISEISHIEADQLRGRQDDPVTGEERGVVQVKGKGGLVRDLFVSPETYEALSAAVEEGGGALYVSQSGYRASLQEAAGDEYEGKSSHGLRWNFAQNRMNACLAHGLGYERSLLQVSREMGRQRADIAERYLGR